MLARGYYVYEHWRPDTDLCFYVGAGRGKRAGNIRARTARHIGIQAELAALGMCVEVRLVKGELTKPEADTLEAKRIALWRGLGIELVNYGDGGPGTTGLKHSAESRARRSAAMMGNRRLADAPRTDEWKANISKAMSGEHNPQYGKKQSEETKLKKAAALRGQKRSPEARRLMSEKAKLREQRKRDAACRSGAS
jgi:hypothetical protein